MKKARKLIPALAMLLVSAVMMSTASFAWFTMNSEVTATGMKVTATSSGGLVIAVSGDQDSAPAEPTNYKSSVDMTGAWSNGATKISPVSHGLANDGTTKGWYTATAGDPSSAAASGDYTAASVGASYYLHQQVYVRTLAETDGILYLDSITVTGNNVNANLDLAIRVALEVNGSWFYFAPTRTVAPTGGFKCAKIVDGSADETASMDVKVVPSAARLVADRADFANVAIGSLDAAGTADQAATTVNIYVYFDGEDPECKSANVKTLAEMGISLEFSSIAGDPEYDA